MTALDLPHNIEPDTTADAVEVEQNYIRIKDYVNSSVIRRDGAVSMDAQLQLVGDPVGERHAASKSYVDAIIPVGVIMCYAGGELPAGSWKLCDGAVLPTSTWPELFAVLQYNYGGSGTQFNLPNFTARFPVGKSATDTRFDKVGKVGGTFLVPVPQHTHPHPHTHPIDHDHPQVSGTTFGGGQHYHSGIFGSYAVSAGGIWLLRRIGDTGTDSIATTSAAVHDHDFNVNIPTFVGPSGAASSANTANAGVQNAEQVQPFVTVNYIIKADPTT